MLPDSAGGPGAPLRQVSPSTSPVSTRADQSVAETAEPLTVEMESCSESEASLVAGYMEVVASAAPGPISPCRTRSMGKARSPKPLEDRDGQAVGGQSSAPSPGPIPPPSDSPLFRGARCTYPSFPSGGLGGSTSMGGSSLHEA